MSEPVVTVDFKVEDCGGESKQVSLEMNRDELKKILSSLEAANKVAFSKTVHVNRQQICSLFYRLFNS